MRVMLASGLTINDELDENPGCVLLGNVGRLGPNGGVARHERRQQASSIKTGTNSIDGSQGGVPKRGLRGCWEENRTIAEDIIIMVGPVK